MPGIVQDLRYALRGFLRAPGFSAAAILTLALGIGAATAIFSIADGLVLRRLPYRDSGRLVVVWNRMPKLGIDRFPLNGETFRLYSAQGAVFESAAGFISEEGTLISGAEPEHILVLYATPPMFSLLGVEPAPGRAFHDDDADVAVLSHSLFMRRFAGDPGVIGRTIRVDERRLKIAGVLPGGFEFDDNAQAPDLWIPLRPEGNGAVTMLARLKPGVSLRSAQASMDALARHADGFSVRVVSLHDEWLGEFRTAALVLLAAAGAVLLIALVNVANLMLARAVAREKEFAVRRAVGASEARLVRQRMTESAVLAAIGAAIGVLGADFALKALVALSPARLPSAVKIAIDARALGMTLAISAAVCLLFGLVPAVAERRLGPRRRAAAPVLVMAEAALATLLLIEAGLLLKSFVSLQHVDAGFNAENLLTMEIDLPAYRYSQAHDGAEFFTQVRERLSALPGVLAATSGSRLPINGAEIYSRGTPFRIEGRPNSATSQTARAQTVDLGYFHTLAIPLVAGRSFAADDTASAPPVAVVNVTLARRFFPPGGAIGQRIAIGAARANAWMTVVGIAGDVKAATLDEQTLPHIYVPFAQHPSLDMAVAVRTARDARNLAREAAAAIRGIDPEVSPTAVMTMEQRLSRSVSRPRFESAIVGFFAGLALLLAAVGIFGVVAHSTSRRTKEIGIRIALGADGGQVVRHVLIAGMRPAIAGILMGVGGAIALRPLVAALLFRVRPGDPWIVTVAACVLTGVAAAACLIPAQRAARVDPMVALRVE